MPARCKKKRKAAQQREQIKKESIEIDISQSATNTFENGISRDKGITDRKVVSGTLHQGDMRFEYLGIQCTYISFWALVTMKMKSPLSWKSDDIDSYVLEGNTGFIQHCFERKMYPQMLLAKQLPQLVRVDDHFLKCHLLDDEIKVGTLIQLSNNDYIDCVSETIGDVIIKCYGIFDSCLFICGGQTIAMAKRKKKHPMHF